MALKQAETHHQRQQPRAYCRKTCSGTKAPVNDPWAFLELIDAPQWADLSLEAGLLGTGEDDPWFHSSHKHHLISLANLNSNTAQLRQHTSSNKYSQNEGLISKNVHNSRPLNKVGHEQCWPRSQMKRIQLQKENKLKSKGRSSTPQAMRCSSSSSSCVSELERIEPSKSVGSSNERLSVSSSLQASSNESSNQLSRTQGEDVCSDQVGGSFVTPTYGESVHSGGQRNRNSSGASFYASEHKLQISRDLHLSKSTADYLVLKDVRSSVDSTITFSGSKPEEHNQCRGKKIWRASSVMRNLDEESEATFAMELNSSRALKVAPTSSNRFPCHSQGVAHRIPQKESLAAVVQTRGSSISMSTRLNKTETRGLHIKSSSSKNCEVGKDFVRQSKCRTNDKLVHAIADGCLSQHELLDVKFSSMKENILRPQLNCIQRKSIKMDRISFQGSCQHFVQTSSVGLSKSLKRESFSRSMLDQRKNARVPLHTLCDSASKNICKSVCGEQDLVALVAQHNRKIRTLRGHDTKKQGTVLSYR